MLAYQSEMANHSLKYHVRKALRDYWRPFHIDMGPKIKNYLPEIIQQVKVRIRAGSKFLILIPDSAAGI